MEALHDNENRRCDRHAGPRLAGFWLRSGDSSAQAASAQRQWLDLHLWRSRRLVGRTEDEPCPWRILSPADQGKIERWHQTLKNRILLENYYLPGDLKQQIDAFVDHYNHHRYHESLQNPHTR